MDFTEEFVHNLSEQEDAFAIRRKKMVETQLRHRGIDDPRILNAFLKVPRHLFVPKRFQGAAYDDKPVPIGLNQTISQPFIVAYMIKQLQLTGSERVLEIGTGSGYEAAILAELVNMVFTVEILPALAHRAKNLLERLGYRNIRFKVGDGHKGWPEYAPYDAIIVSAAPEELPGELVRQLAPGGRMAIPIGEEHQMLNVLTVDDQGEMQILEKIPVRFVPLIHGNENSKPEDTEK